MSERARREVVVITGASAGVGRAVARVYGARGARVGLVARGRDGLEAALREIEAAGGGGLVLPLDVADAPAVEAAAAEVERQLGPIDVWINNAMVSVFSPVAEMRPEEYRRVTEVTYLGYVHGTLAALQRMRPRDRGVIVQVGSALAYRGIPLQSASAEPSTPSRASPIPCGASCFTRGAGCASPRSTCRRSTRRSSRGCAAGSRASPSPSPRSSSRRWRRAPSRGPPTIRAGS
jgi:NAD(P)-dependent dehydrogenase (short-subunit alcohol dehydrogenase family)